MRGCVEGDDLGDQTWHEDDWTSGDWSLRLMDLTQPGMMIEGWSDGWTDASWSAVLSSVEKATSPASPSLRTL